MRYHLSSLFSLLLIYTLDMCICRPWGFLAAALSESRLPVWPAEAWRTVWQVSFCTLVTAGAASSRVSLGRGTVALHAVAHLSLALSGYVLVLHAHKVVTHQV